MLKPMHTEQEKIVSIIIVTWNVKDFLRQCLNSVYKETKDIQIEVIVIDNASVDGTSEMVKEQFPQVRLITAEKNLGYTKANNLAIREVLKEGKSDFLLLLNSDTVFQNNAVDQMASYLTNNPDVGAVSPALILPNGKFQTGTAGFLPTAWTGFTYFSFLFKLFPKKTKSFFIEPSYFSKKRSVVSVDWMSGACLMLRKETIEKTGLMDEKYFIYADDIDWGKRMKQEGFLLHYLPWLHVLHYHGITYDKIHKRTNTDWLAMLYTYIRKERGLFEYRLFRLFSIEGFFLRLFLYVLLFGLKRDAATKKKVKELWYFFLFSIRGRKFQK